MYINGLAKDDLTYDAIVVGSGISGGWSAKELTENGLNTLVLERGRNVEHIKDYPTSMLDPWELPANDDIPHPDRQHYEKQLRTGYTIKESTKHWWVKDTDQPYEEIERFDWIRGYHVGGRSIMWGRFSLRLSQMDFEANAVDGYGVDWPIRYEDIEPWYTHVEKFAGISGKSEGLSQLPDSHFLPPMELSCVELELQKSMKQKFGRVLTNPRMANLTQPLNGRGQCMTRNLCMRGCPLGAYFSSNAVTLPAAAATGRLTIRPHSIVHSLEYNESTGKVSGVHIIDELTGEMKTFHSKIVFLNASAIASAMILLNSRSNRFPNGLGNDSDQVGRNVMDHHFQIGANGTIEGFEDQYDWGRRPQGFYIPRYRNVGKDKREYVRGFGYQGGSGRQGWHRAIAEAAIGSDLKQIAATPGPWSVGMMAFGEMLPHEDNRIFLNFEKLDKWGLPTAVFDVKFRDNEYKMRVDMMNDAAEMIEAMGAKNVSMYDNKGAPGLGIHEMGTARMGRDPKTSVLNKWNQIHNVPNVFITDGACMTSSACQNPSLTYMALSARAANYAADLVKKGDI